jgi:hypothetical protein
MAVRLDVRNESDVGSHRIVGETDMRKPILVVFTLASLLFSAPEQAANRIQCWDGVAVPLQEGYPGCLVTFQPEGCAYCVVVPGI